MSIASGPILIKMRKTFQNLLSRTAIKNRTHIIKWNIDVRDRKSAPAFRGFAGPRSAAALAALAALGTFWYEFVIRSGSVRREKGQNWRRHIAQRVCGGWVGGIRDNDDVALGYMCMPVICASIRKHNIYLYIYGIFYRP